MDSIHDFPGENMSSKDLLEIVAELDYSHSQQKKLNIELRRCLDAADEDMAVLCLENANLKKQVKVQQTIASRAQQVEEEPCSSPLADDHGLDRCNSATSVSEQQMSWQEKESITLGELTAELKSLQQKSEQEKMSASKLRAAIQSLECAMEEAQLGWQQRDDVINQKDLQVKFLEENLEESHNIIKDLRRTNREQKTQLEEKIDEASFVILSDVMREKQGSPNLPLSLAEEIELLVSSGELKTGMANSTALRHVEPPTDAEEPEIVETEELLKPQRFTFDLQTRRFARNWETAIQRGWVFALCFIILTVLVIGKSDFFSTKTLWHGVQLMFKPYCRVHYGALPPM